MNTLSNKDITEICKKMKLPLKGIYFKDDLPNNLYGFYIINLQSKNDNGNGTHWTSFYYDNGNNGNNYYYDSFGFPPPRETEEKIKPYLYSTKNIQNIKSSSCGYYCIAFIKFLSKLKNKKEGFKLFINLFDKDTRKNEFILEKILYEM